MSEIMLDPLGTIYAEIKKIIESITIKNSYQAEQNETYDSKLSADEYIDAYYKRDVFTTYRDYTVDDFYAVGLTDVEIIRQAQSEDIRVIPERYQEPLLAIRRQRVIDKYEEQNDYYRMLNGYPSLATTELNYHYIPEDIADKYGIDETVPIHKIQDYYNKLTSGTGDYMIQIIQSIGYIDDLIDAHPTEKYLKYIGTKRITIPQARNAKNYSILALTQGYIRYSIYNSFLEIYDQCREYFMTVVFNGQMRGFIDYYDNFIGLCIMVMTINQIIMNQLPLGVKRNFFDINAVRALYEAYDVPYNIHLDEDTQNRILQNLNLLIQEKSDNKVIYDIAELLGFSTVVVNKYYLTKERQFDQYGVPVTGTTTKFNTDTGLIEEVPDYEKMYKVYFQKSELREEDFVQSFNNAINETKYDDMIDGDPFWWKDQNTYKKVWETEYNFVESKYLGLSVTYKMSDVLYENILLLKFLQSQRDNISDITITLPKILPYVNIPIYDAITLLLCLTAKKHNLTGEIISIPTQVISVLDYLQNVDGGSEYCVDTFSFDFDFFRPDNNEGRELLREVEMELGLRQGSDEAVQFMKYIDVLSFTSTATNEEKIQVINDIYANIKGLGKFLNYQMTCAKTRRTYDALKTLYRTIYYSKEMKSLFTITGETSGNERTAKTYFEYLYHINKQLYKSIFTVDFETQYEEYLSEHELKGSDLTFTEYKEKVDLGEIDVKYDTLIDESSEEGNTEDRIYYYVNHIIFHLETIIKDLKYIYLMNDTSTPLETLLVKMIRFFKSYTVDLLGLETIYICDMKQENMLKFFDEINCIVKDIELHDDVKISYADVIHLLTISLQLDEGLKLKDKMMFEALMYLCKDNDGNYLNSLLLNDRLTYDKTIGTNSAIDLFDAVHFTESTLEVHEKMGLRDEVVRVWFSDPEEE